MPGGGGGLQRLAFFGRVSSVLVPLELIEWTGRWLRFLRSGSFFGLAAGLKCSSLRSAKNRKKVLAENAALRLDQRPFETPGFASSESATAALVNEMCGEGSVKKA